MLVLVLVLLLFLLLLLQLLGLRVSMVQSTRLDLYSIEVKVVNGGGCSGKGREGCQERGQGGRGGGGQVSFPSPHQSTAHLLPSASSTHALIQQTG